MQVILGSQSPRRRALIALLGLDVQLLSADVDEEAVQGATPAEDALLTARLKVDAIVATLKAQATRDFVVIGCDTNVSLGQTLLQKPADAAEAWAMLDALRGQPHQVHTAHVVAHADGRVVEEVVTSDVFMRDYSAAEMAAYIETGDPMDKAGAYAIQATTFAPVEHWEGCYAGIVGLSLCATARLLRQVGVEIDAAVPNVCEGACFQQAAYGLRLDY